ncbi:FadR family transcriptional regulator [Neobacillus mesonae]|nr:FadR family transcriptional regulator [Neobacillus mesonae]
MMRITPLRGSEQVANLILDKIQHEEWLPGHRLPSVVELSQTLGVGRSTIREAVSALKATGWLDVRHGGGTFVSKQLPIDSATNAVFQGAESLIELLEVRMALEIKSASLAAEKRNNEDLRKLRHILAEMEHGHHHGDTAESERADVQFHMAITAASGNSLLVQLMESLTGRFTDTIGKSRELWFYSEKATSSRLLDEHHKIYQAIEQQDKLLSERLMTDHLSKVEHVLAKK